MENRPIFQEPSPSPVIQAKSGFLILLKIHILTVHTIYPGFMSCLIIYQHIFLRLVSQTTRTVSYTFSSHSIYQNLFYFKGI